MTYRIEQPYKIQANDIWFFQTITTGWAIGGVHIPRDEVMRRLEAKVGAGKLVKIDNEWFWQLN